MAKKIKNYNPDPHYCPPIDNEKIRRRHIVDIRSVGDISNVRPIRGDILLLEEYCRNCNQILEVFVSRKGITNPDEIDLVTLHFSPKMED